METKRDYYPVVMMSIGFLLYILSDFVQKYPYNLILIFVSIAIFLLILLEPFLIYMKNTLKSSKKKFGAIIGAIIIIVISFILYFLIGLGTAFYVTVAGFIVTYSLAIIALFSSNGKEIKLKNAKTKNKIQTN